jgi:hypothetical protein
MNIRRFSAISIIIIIAMVGCGGDGGGSGDSHTPMGTLSVNVVDAIDDTPVNDASITVYDSSNILVTRGLTVNGNFDYSLSPGTYTIKAAAQDYLPVPPSNQSAVPFEIIDGQTTTESIALDAHPNAGNTGQISGSLLMSDLSGVSDVLVVAEHNTLDLFASGVSGPDGSYALYNVESGTYTLTAYRAGYRETSAQVTVDVAAAGNHVDNDIEVEMFDSADLSGSVTFLAVTNGTIDITLIHPDTLDTIPGCSTTNDATNDYLLEDIPAGTFITWASFRNDGYVMDPDWIDKNGGKPEVTFADVDQVQNFSVTGAVALDFPTNDASPVIPEIIDTATPTFTWTKYASAKEYIIEVFDSQGNTIWGGYNGVVIAHNPITGTSADFDFDGTATVSLEDGKTYRWKIYADSIGTDGVVDTLISSSEDLMGLFTYIQN